MTTFSPLSQEVLFLFGFSKVSHLNYQRSADELVQQSLQLKQGKLNDTGALVIQTGTFTGRSPENRFFVKDDFTESKLNWNKFNIPIEEEYFDVLKKALLEYLKQKEDVWVRDCFACAYPAYRINIRIINETPADNLFAYNMFLRPKKEELAEFVPDWHIVHAPGFKADPPVHGTRNPHFIIVSFTHKTILIGGTGYTGEIKKAIFTVLNYLLPVEHGILSMHCSANMDQDGNTAVFFGLSGTGKTTLSSDATRKLIGDDEHGWNDDSIFNFEGGCYAKTINLSREQETDIYDAIRPGALIENMCFMGETNKLDFTNNSITENTRVSYPLHYIDKAAQPSIGRSPRDIFFLTCDATGVLPPISQLTPAQAMYHFISGYTSKVAGTEVGITEPGLTFSACFGAPFLPLHPGYYADMLGNKLKKEHINVWLINTGWTGGPYGTGKRISISYSRAMIAAALNGDLKRVPTQHLPVFGLTFPVNCPGVPPDILNPRNTWTDKDAYDKQLAQLARQFVNNFDKYASSVSEEILGAGPICVSSN